MEAPENVCTHTQAPDESMHASARDSGHVQITKVVIPESVEKAATKVLIWFLSIVAVLVAIIGACGVVMGIDIADRHATERRAEDRAASVQREADLKIQQLDRDFKEAATRLMLNERRLMDREAYDILNGSKYFSDDAHGPTGNLKRMKPKER